MWKIHNKILRSIKEDPTSWPIHKGRTDNEMDAYRDLIRYGMIEGTLGKHSHRITKDGIHALRLGYHIWLIYSHINRFVSNYIKFRPL